MQGGYKKGYMQYTCILMGWFQRAASVCCVEAVHAYVSVTTIPGPTQTAIAMFYLSDV